MKDRLSAMPFLTAVVFCLGFAFSFGVLALCGTHTWRQACERAVDCTLTTLAIYLYQRLFSKDEQ